MCRAILELALETLRDATRQRAKSKVGSRHCMCCKATSGTAVADVSHHQSSSLHECKSAAQACVHGQEKCGQENVGVCTSGVGHAFMEMEESSVTRASLLYQDVRLVENVLPRNEAVWHADQQWELLQVFQEWLNPSRGIVVRAELRGLKPFLATCIDGFESMTLKDATSPKPRACILRRTRVPRKAWAWAENFAYCIRQQTTAGEWAVDHLRCQENIGEPRSRRRANQAHGVKSWMRRRQVFATAHESELAVFLKVTEEVICTGSSMNTHLQGGQHLGMVGGVAEVLQELHEQCIGLHHTIPTAVAVEETMIGGCWSKDKTHAKRHEVVHILGTHISLRSAFEERLEERMEIIHAGVRGLHVQDPN